ncbi:MAG: DinB family protein [Acidobacteria bacterium]|nr:DinB family protein [Acidobacteriota bacterium]
MSEAERIADQLRRAFEGNAWHGPALREILSGVTATQAVARPLPRAHSIWEIVLHIGVWESVVRRRLAGEVIVDLPPEQDWPAVADTSDAAWRKTLAELARGHQALRQAIAGLSEAQLAAPVAGQDYSVYVMLHGVVQHDLYHAGQLALLKKALT